ncbi:MAG TPA: epoxide hydrolase [Candidatus Binataceae bacterium]|nr:epoxide hydrolase [Candidatus Binataceae bacterium]
MTKEPFKVAIPDSVLTDLKERLRRVRYPIDFANENWAYGTNRAYLEEMVAYWLGHYDWRKHEAEINRFAHYRTNIGGIPIHFIHEAGKGPKPIPLILSHGWPWTFWDLHKVIRPLADPAAFGGDPADAFDVVVPSLPGFCFSTPLTTPGVNWWRTADLWLTLMREVLGYSRFAAEGGDWGAFVTQQLGHKYPQHMIAIYLTLSIPMNFFSGGGFKESDYGADEQAALARTREARPSIISHVAVQTRDPQTLAYGMHDSPVALLAWMLERRRAWSDCGGNVERRYSKDELLTHIMLYWVTECFVTSVRYYYEARNHPWKPVHDRMPVVEAPTGIGVFPRELLIPPRQWAEKYFNLQRWTPMASGGHFAPSEEPDQLVQDLRAFYRSYR